MTAPFKWDLPIPRMPVATDAIPDIGENQQIVFTKWPGRSPQDVEDQITYPLTVALMGVPEVKTVRSFSMFGFSSIYVVFKDSVDFYWSRTRILEKLNALNPGTLPENATPTLGPDATSLGQVFWYTLEGRDLQGKPTGGWDLDELRSVQDWHVRYAISSADGVSEVASIGGFVKEYQIDVDPDALRHYGVDLKDIYMAVKMANLDIGAKTIEINRVEYVIRGIGFIKSLKDIENTVIKTVNNTPIFVRQVATISQGPALRRGVLDKSGAEAVGGVVVMRFGANPMQVIDAVKLKIKELSPGLPSKTLNDGTESKLEIVPFYDRTGLIEETLGTLNKALSEEILITICVVLLMLMNLRASILISLLLPLSILMVFIAMKHFGVDANIVALSGIAIAIGTIVDMGIVMTENIVSRLKEATEKDNVVSVIAKSSAEVGSAVLTAVLTTIVSFLPVFTMTGAEGKLFKPLAFTKTFALGSSIILTLTVIPVLALLLYRKNSVAKSLISNFGEKIKLSRTKLNLTIALIMILFLSKIWMPIGESNPYVISLIAVLGMIGGFLLFFSWFQKQYPIILKWSLENKSKFLIAPALILMIGFGSFASLGKEFLPALDEGAFLYMPTTMTHASISEVHEIMQKQDMAISQIPEVESVVGKLGRADTALDPAPISMIESIISYKPEYSKNESGEWVRNWRGHIKSTDDIWKEIQKAAQVPGVTSAPKLQPIEARIVMLQSGVRAPMAIKVKGPNLDLIETFGIKLESILRQVPTLDSESVFADRLVAKPYYEIHIDREAISQHGIMLNSVQKSIQMAVGGAEITTTVEGRERYPVRIRYKRELRDSIDSLKDIRISSSKGYQVPLVQLAEFKYVKGPQVIKSEDTFLTSYVIFDKKEGVSEMQAVNQAKEYLNKALIEDELVIPKGVSYEFTGNYQNLIRSEKTLKLVLPLALTLIFLILYLQFNSPVLTSLVFSGILLAWAGGFIMLWLWGAHLSTAVWVGFLALFGIASDDGVMMGTFLKQTFESRKPSTVQDIHLATIEAGTRRIRPCLMTTATTLLALLPVLSSTGRGSDIMVPMAIPTFGGMFVAIITVLTTPVLYAWFSEKKLLRGTKS